VLCYETTDRNGSEGRDAGLEENRAFLSSGNSALTRGMAGAHASFTLSDESLGSLAGIVASSRTGLHVHAAEDGVDGADSRRRCGAGVVERLRRHGLIRAGTLLVHGVQLEDGELREAQAGGAWLVHCPRSNLNNGVGHARTASFRRAALGTDGLDEDALAEARAAYLGMRDDGRTDASAAALAMLAGGQRLASEVFGLRLGQLDGERPGEPGDPADLVVLDYRPPTPLHAGNLAGHVLFGVDRSHVRSTMVAGRFVLRDRRIVTVDEAALVPRARLVAERLWRRMREL
jgi:cytosine/adenosine deaminase-related metal-dependent hydrolase